ncbi:uncharacterized protein LOC105280863 isoform X2 [Ooceraea biroi]|uniref:uncharacterized protein LOC105280863 isoform X2 n=1 Tax=Ooceraea biroi TaxID=2015173 RepID=UPI0005B8144E|nr:uncharacterized protein LOC105280863 isoform X2 [Ooceraea biroi]
MCTSTALRRTGIVLSPRSRSSRSAGEARRSYPRISVTILVLRLSRRDYQLPKRKRERAIINYNYRPSLQRSYSRQAIPVTNPGNVESLWPVGVFLPPIDVNDLGYSWYETRRAQPDVYKLRARDPYLLTGREAMMAVKYLYGLGELFFDDYPHAVALLRHQEERMLNGLHGHVLSSLNPRFPFQRKGVRGN